MTRVESIEREVIERDWQAWDRELERDVPAGRLDRFADEALAEVERDETTEL